jgi:thiol:disulfide interchange protein
LKSTVLALIKSGGQFMKLQQVAVVALSFCALAMGSGACARPSMFSDLTLQQAKERADKDNKLVLVDFTATWCGPCQHMDKTTWKDAAVEDWVKKNAIAVQVDVDAQKETAMALKIQAMPTVIVFKPRVKEEVTRKMGVQSSDELLQWLNAAKEGRVTGEQ